MFVNPSSNSYQYDLLSHVWITGTGFVLTTGSVVIKMKGFLNYEVPQWCQCQFFDFSGRIHTNKGSYCSIRLQFQRSPHSFYQKCVSKGINLLCSLDNWCQHYVKVNTSGVNISQRNTNTTCDITDVLSSR